MTQGDLTNADQLPLTQNQSVRDRNTIYNISYIHTSFKRDPNYA